MQLEVQRLMQKRYESTKRGKDYMIGKFGVFTVSLKEEGRRIKGKHGQREKERADHGGAAKEREAGRGEGGKGVETHWRYRKLSACTSRAKNGQLNRDR
jgi:hypothetical protein